MRVPGLLAVIVGPAPPAVVPPEAMELNGGGWANLGAGATFIAAVWGGGSSGSVTVELAPMVTEAGSLPASLRVSTNERPSVGVVHTYRLQRADAGGDTWVTLATWTWSNADIKGTNKGVAIAAGNRPVALGDRLRVEMTHDSLVAEQMGGSWAGVGTRD